MIVFHILKESEWNNFEQSQFYEDLALKTNGFIHCCTFDQILHVANSSLKNINDSLLILCLNTEYLSAELKWEENPKNKMIFPHLYGSINKEAVIGAVKFQKNENGEFFISDELYSYKNIEKSCGAIVIRKFESAYKTLLIGFPHNEKLNWGFPKGHVEKNETEHETAKREIKEETGLDVDIIPNFREHTYFSCKKGVTQEVIYFGAVASSDKVTPQESEVEKCMWCSLNEAPDKITFDCDREIFIKFIKFIKA